MSSPPGRNLRRFEVGGLPLIQAVIGRIGLRPILAECIPISGRHKISPIDVLVLLAVNLTVAKDPLYRLDDWVDSLDLRPLGFRRRPQGRFTDDRFAHALDMLFRADRASLQTRLVVAALKAFDVRLERIHNDSTSVKACGRIPGRTPTGLELRHGYSKDHRPDLKQLIFSLSISADGAVPIHHRVYPGNRNDETTHIETWECLRRLHGGAGFLYVADCKLCTRDQLAHIAAAGGRAITILPQNLNEARDFIGSLRDGPIAKKLLWRRPKPCEEHTTEYFHLFQADRFLAHGGYPIYWFVSSQKRKRDQNAREQRLLRAETALAELAHRLNTPRLARPSVIRKAAGAILCKLQVEPFLQVRVRAHIQRWRVRPRGRPSGRHSYRIRQKATYSLDWARNAQTLRRERRVDGVFPLLCTDPSLTPLCVLRAWKFQPHLEKRFEQFKHVHRAAPLLFKRIRRVEATMFLFFVALMIQALLERWVRRGLQQRNAPPLRLYPEDRDAPHPTTSQILKSFDGLSAYSISQNATEVESYRDPLKEVHRRVLEVLGLDERPFWGEQ